MLMLLVDDDVVTDDNDGKICYVHQGGSRKNDIGGAVFGNDDVIKMTSSYAIFSNYWGVGAIARPLILPTQRKVCCE